MCEDSNLICNTAFKFLKNENWKNWHCCSALHADILKVEHSTLNLPPDSDSGQKYAYETV